MINKPPRNWLYNDSMESLFLFFQRCEEMFNPDSLDTYQLPVHYTLSLCMEITRIFSELEALKCTDDYYDNYIPIIIDELIYNIEKDSVIVERLGQRKESVIGGLKHSKSNPKALMKWINQVTQSCSVLFYLESYQKLIKEYIIENRQTEKLLKAIERFFIALKHFGYSVKYMQTCLYKFFLGKEIDRPECITDFFRMFSLEIEEMEFYILFDSHVWDYFCKMDRGFETLISMEPLAERDVYAQANQEGAQEALNIFYSKYKGLKNRQPKRKIKMVRCRIKGYDPNSAIENLHYQLKSMGSLLTYFRHQRLQNLLF